MDVVEEEHDDVVDVLAALEQDTAPGPGEEALTTVDQTLTFSWTCDLSSDDPATFPFLFLLTRVDEDDFHQRIFSCPVPVSS